MQRFLEDPESGLLNLEAHHKGLAITKKTLDENHFQTAQKTTNREAPSFKIGDRVYFKNKKSGKWNLKWMPGYQIVCIRALIDTTFTSKIRQLGRQDHAMLRT